MGIVFWGNPKERHHRIRVTDREQLDTGIDVRASAKWIRWLKQTDGVEAIPRLLELAESVLDDTKGRSVILRQVRWPDKGDVEATITSNARDLVVFRAKHYSIERLRLKRRLGGPLKEGLATERANVFSRYTLGSAPSGNQSENPHQYTKPFRDALLARSDSVRADAHNRHSYAITRRAARGLPTKIARAIRFNPYEGYWPLIW